MHLKHRYGGQLITKVKEYEAHSSLREGMLATRFQQLGSSIRGSFPANLLGGDRGGIRTRDGHAQNDTGVQTRLASTTRHHPTTVRYFIALDVAKRVSVRLGRFWTLKTSETSRETRWCKQRVSFFSASLL